MDRKKILNSTYFYGRPGETQRVDIDFWPDNFGLADSSLKFDTNLKNGFLRIYGDNREKPGYDLLELYIPTWTWRAMPFNSTTMRPELYDYYRWFNFGWWVWDHVNRRLIDHLYWPLVINLNESGTGADLAWVVRSICHDLGLRDEHIDTSQLSGVVEGFSVRKNRPAREILNTLAQAYFFEAAERDGKLVFFHYGSQPIATLNADDVLRESDNTWALEETSRPALELPTRVNCNYIEKEQDYQRALQVAARSVDHLPRTSNDTSNIDVPVVMSPDEARQVAEVHLFSAWAHRFGLKAKATWKTIIYDPGDVVNFVFPDGRVGEYRFTNLALGKDYSVEMALHSDDHEVYTSEAVGAVADGFREQTLIPPPPVEPILLDTPYLRDTDAQSSAYSLFYSAVRTVRDGFGGALLLTKAGGIDWTQRGGVSSAVVWGIVGNDISLKRAQYATDTYTVIEVNLPQGQTTELTSVTYLELMNGANAAAVGREGRWEILQFQTAEHIAAGRYRLSNLVRGRRGTDWAIPRHTKGDTFVLLDTSDFLPTRTLAENTGAELELKAAQAGETIAEAPVITTEYRANDLRPYAPANFKSVQHPSGDIDISWSRRTRLNGELKDGTGNVPIHEESEEYRVYLINSSFAGMTEEQLLGESLYYREATVYQPSFTYTAVMQAADPIDIVANRLHVVVFQVSASVGIGFPGWASFEVT